MRYPKDVIYKDSCTICSALFYLKCLNSIFIQVHVNDKYFTEFNHRGGVNEASHFNIVGNLDIQDVEYFEPLVSTPVETQSLWKRNKNQCLILSQSVGNIFYVFQEDDFVKTFPSGLVKGDVLIFRGFMKPGGDT